MWKWILIGWLSFIAWSLVKILSSAGPERSQQLQILPSLAVRRFSCIWADILPPPSFCLRLYFVNTYILPVPSFCWHLVFVGGNILSTCIFCRGIYFVDANNFDVANNFVQYFCRAYVFAGASILSLPIFLILFSLRMIICSNDCGLSIS
jgi:hypothetical protein